MGNKLYALIAREKTHYTLRAFELKTKSMAGGGDDGLFTRIKYFINAGTYIFLVNRSLINAIKIVNQFETGLD